VRIAEREMYLSPEPIRKVSRGLEIGFICRDRLGNPTRALQAFRRVLELDPEQDEAQAAAADLLAKLGRWKEHVVMLERMLQRVVAASAADPEASMTFADERRSLVQRIAAATADKLGDPRGAFRWWRRAHDEAPDEQTLADVRRAGEAYGLWRELAEVITDERKRLIAAGGGVPAEPERFVALSRELAQLCERRLGDKPRGIAIFAEALAAAPRDAELLSELERLAAELDQRPIWKHLLDAYELVLTAATPSERVELYLRRARILDERAGDPKGAVADVLAAFSWSPDRDDVRQALEALAPKARAWNDLIAVDSALIERAATTPKRVELLRRKAATIEDQLKDAPRAFRTHLIALLLAPEETETASHLWRLARVIGKYRDADKTPRAEPPSATIQAEAAVANAVASANRAAPLRPRIPNRAQTDPLSDDDLSGASLHVGDSTQPLDLTELEMAEARKQQVTGENPFVTPENSTMTLSMNDIAKMVVPPGPPARTPPRLPGVATGPSKLPPPPPRPPQITAGAPRARRVSAPPPMPRKAQAPVRRPPLPTLPNRVFETPWEELAVAYEALPAPDPSARLRWLFRASEVWETGGKDIARAFDALARAFGTAKRAPEGDAEVRARLHRIASEHKAWDRLADLYEGLAEQAETAHAAADLLMEVANIRFEQKRPRETEAQLRRILGMLPNEVTARARIEELYRAEGRWVELAASLEERTDPRLGTAAPEAERPQLLRDLTAIYTDRINRPHDAIDAFERLRVLAPADTAVYMKLAELYGTVGRWSKVIETFVKVSEIAEGSDEARVALRQIAKIYEQELELPDRAIDSYQQLVAIWPDDEDSWTALDRLYQAQARWTELGDVLRRRAGLAREPAERAQLLARRAGVLLDWLASPEEAAATLRHARTILPDDPQIADALVIALGKAGREREAAAILEGRITAFDVGDSTNPEVDARPEPKGKGKQAQKAEPSGRSKGDLAALHIKLAQLKLDDKDRDGAREAIEAALALVPEHPTALGLLGQLQSPDEDPRAFADAKLREADSARDEDSKIAALMAAGDVLVSRVGDLEAAQAAYDRVLGLRPYHADATWARAGIHEKGGDPEAASLVLEKKLEDETLTPPEKARILTQLAALSRAAGVTPASERRLLEALGTVPDHIPAIVALADFYADAERWTDLEAFMREILDGTTLASAPGALVADLHRRLATAHEKLGR
ncbi:MAG: tetratricopeptide repeat protein, partial [Deltaproteobacteria bacterium]